MICTICKSLDKRSKVFVANSANVLIAFQPYFDEDGRFCDAGNKNKLFEHLRCSNGHEGRSESKDGTFHTVIWHVLPLRKK